MLDRDDPSPFSVLNSGSSAAWLLVCDHAGRAIPGSLNGLGLPKTELDRHIGWDIGAGALADRMGHALGACVIRQTYSRLVIDCNRDPARADAFVEVADGATVPGNVGLDASARAARVQRIHKPYHARIARELDKRAAEGLSTLVVSIHSFTPSMGGTARPWKTGVLHLNDSPLSARMLKLLAAERGMEVGDNKPYAMDGVDYTVPYHAIGRGLDYLELEVRQDLIADTAGQTLYAELLTRLLRKASK